MADGGFPNRNRADNAITIYRDAMREYIAPILERQHGPNWIRSQVLNDDLRERNPRSYDQRLQSHKNGTSARNLIDLADIPFLIRNNSDAFPNLRPADAQRMHQIRDLRNEIQHADREGDCTSEEASAIAAMCVMVLDRCRLPDAAEQIRGLSTAASTGLAAVSEAELREQRERREWDKSRLAGKSPEELTPWEQERLAEIEWEEEWELREAERQEITQFGDDIDGLRRWFDTNRARPKRHPSEYTALVRREEEREREQQKREREQKRAERERAELAAFRYYDIDGLRRWFDANRARPQRHPSKYAKLVHRERGRELERAKIAAFRDNINGLRRWFDTDKVRRKRHRSEYAALVRREKELKRAGPEGAKIAAFGNNIDGLRRWFDANQARAGRHSSEYAALARREEERECERAELAAFGDDINGLRRWFDTDKVRRKRHPSKYAALVRWEKEREEREERKRERKREGKRARRERAKIAAFGDDIASLRRWFDANQARAGQHSSEYAALVRREEEPERKRERKRVGRERAKIAAFGDDIASLRRWFDANQARPKRHPSEYAALVRREREREHKRQEREQRGRREQEKQSKSSLLSRFFRR